MTSIEEKPTGTVHEYVPGVVQDWVTGADDRDAEQEAVPHVQETEDPALGKAIDDGFCEPSAQKVSVRNPAAE
ncbi:MAG: hypothetical protein QMC36_06720 [Patescibacteria group bacterium]